MATCIGQTFKMTLEITQEKGGTEETVNVTVDLPIPHGWHCSQPSCISGRASEEAYLSEFQVAEEVVEDLKSQS